MNIFFQNHYNMRINIFVVSHESRFSKDLSLSFFFSEKSNIIVINCLLRVNRLPQHTKQLHCNVNRTPIMLYDLADSQKGNIYDSLNKLTIRIWIKYRRSHSNRYPDKWRVMYLTISLRTRADTNIIGIAELFSPEIYVTTNPRRPGLRAG